MAEVERKRFKKINGKYVPFTSWVLEYEPYEYTYDNIQMLCEKIRTKLTPDLLSKKYKSTNTTNPLFGHCVHSTQALYYLLDTDRLNPMSGQDDLGNIHWWLQDEDLIIDATAGQYDFMECEPPYRSGKKTPWYGWKQRPHKRTLTLIQRVQPDARMYKRHYEHNEEGLTTPRLF